MANVRMNNREARQPKQKNNELSSKASYYLAHLYRFPTLPRWNEKHQERRQDAAV